MKLSINLDFWFDEIDECTEKEVAVILQTVLRAGAETCCCEISDVSISGEYGTII